MVARRGPQQTKKRAELLSCGVFKMCKGGLCILHLFHIQDPDMKHGVGARRKVREVTRTETVRLTL